MKIAPFVKYFGFTVLIVHAVLATAGDRRHGAHEHGSASLNFAQDEAKILIEFKSPAANVMGFEHQPETDAEQQRLNAALKILRDGEALFKFSSSAGCELADKEINSPFVDGSDALDNDQAHHDHDEQHEHGESHDQGEAHEHDEHLDHKGRVHTDLQAVWHFQCDNITALSEIEISIFEAFPDTEKLQVQFITEKKQGAAILTPDDPVLRLSR